MMTKNKNKTFTEKEFDNIFSSKSKGLYDFDTSGMSRRDIGIIKQLYEFGVAEKKCLDIGPGTGRWLQFLKNNNAKSLSSADLSQEALDRSSDICIFSQKLNIEFEELEIETESQDIILCFMVLEHIVDPTNLINEIIRVAKNGALILMSIPNIASLNSRVRLLCGFMPRAISSDKTHVKFYTKKELKQLFKPLGQSAEIIPTSFSLHPFNSKKLRIPSFNLTKSLDDHILFKLIINK